MYQNGFFVQRPPTSQVSTCKNTWTLETTATRRAHARFSLRSNRSEQTMTFIADTSSKEERRRWGLKGAVPEVQSPQTIDRDRISKCVLQLAEEIACVLTEGVDPAIAEVADQQCTAKFAEAQGSNRQPPG